jgi:hypothetical protein
MQTARESGRMAGAVREKSRVFRRANDYFKKTLTRLFFVCKDGVAFTGGRKSEPMKWR